MYYFWNFLELLFEMLSTFLPGKKNHYSLSAAHSYASVDLLWIYTSESVHQLGKKKVLS